MVKQSFCELTNKQSSKISQTEVGVDDSNQRCAESGFLDSHFTTNSKVLTSEPCDL